MNTEKLINCVYNRRPLWDKSDAMYHHRDVAKEMWNEVCEEMGMDTSAVELVKKRWNSLRDMFRREFHRANRPDGTESVPMWAPYKSMLFLCSQMKQRNFTNNVINDMPELQEHAQNENSIPETQFETSTTEQVRKRIKRRPSEDTNEIFDYERRPTKTYENNAFLENDESDYHFLMSLLPFIKTIPYQRKLAVRTKLQQVINEEHIRMMEMPSPQTSISFNPQHTKFIHNNNNNTDLLPSEHSSNLTIATSILPSSSYDDAN